MNQTSDRPQAIELGRLLKRGPRITDRARASPASPTGG